MFQVELVADFHDLGKTLALNKPPSNLVLKYSNLLAFHSAVQGKLLLGLWDWHLRWLRTWPEAINKLRHAKTMKEMQAWQIICVSINYFCTFAWEDSIAVLENGALLLCICFHTKVGTAVVERLPDLAAASSTKKVSVFAFEIFMSCCVRLLQWSFMKDKNVSAQWSKSSEYVWADLAAEVAFLSKFTQQW